MPNKKKYAGDIIDYNDTADFGHMDEQDFQMPVKKRHY